MKFTVIWTPGAEQELARLWLNAIDRTDIAAAADQIDAGLVHDPHSAGESRGGATRIVILTPLAVLYDVDEPNRKVTIWDLWRSQ